jgi:hypothetical protein
MVSKQAGIETLKALMLLLVLFIPCLLQAQDKDSSLVKRNKFYLSGNIQIGLGTGSIDPTGTVNSSSGINLGLSLSVSYNRNFIEPKISVYAPWSLSNADVHLATQEILIGRQFYTSPGQFISVSAGIASDKFYYPGETYDNGQFGGYLDFLNLVHQRYTYVTYTISTIAIPINVKYDFNLRKFFGLTAAYGINLNSNKIVNSLSLEVRIGRIAERRR